MAGINLPDNAVISRPHLGFKETYRCHRAGSQPDIRKGELHEMQSHRAACVRSGRSASEVARSLLERVARIHRGSAGRV